MAKIQIKRGLQTNVERLALSEGELAVALDTGNVYVGTTSGKTWLNPPTDAAQTALRLQTAREFSVAGDATSPAVTFDGTQNAQLTVALATMPGLTPGTYSKLTVDAKGRVTGAVALTGEDLPAVPVSKLDTGTGAGQVVTVGADGRIAPALLPDIAIGEVFEAASQAAMLALSAQTGDVCIRSDEAKTYMLAAVPATALANWKWLRTPDCKVLSVQGKTGAVQLTKEDITALGIPGQDTVYTLPAATTVTLGGVKVGSGLAVTAGVVSVGDVDAGTF